MVTSLTDHLALLADLGEPGAHDPEPEPLVLVPLLPVPGDDDSDDDDNDGDDDNHGLRQQSSPLLAGHQRGQRDCAPADRGGGQPGQHPQVGGALLPVAAFLLPWGLGDYVNKHFEPVLVCCGFFLTVK